MTAPHQPRVPPRLLFLCVGLGTLASCHAPVLSEEPFAFAQPGRVAITARPALFTLYGIDGTFRTMDFASGGTLVEEDSGDIVGRLGGALRADVWLSARWIAALGADYRRYDVEGLTPTEELDVAVETIDSLQYFLSLRHLLPAVDAARRLRPFGEVSLAYLPSVDVGFTVDLSEFGASNLVIESSGGDFWVGGIAGGVSYQLTDRLLLELGLSYELPLNDLDVDLGFEIAGNAVPLEASLAPEGWVGFAGISWVL